MNLLKQGDALGPAQGLFPTHKSCSLEPRCSATSASLRRQKEPGPAAQQLPAGGYKAAHLVQTTVLLPRPQMPRGTPSWTLIPVQCFSPPATHPALCQTLIHSWGHKPLLITRVEHLAFQLSQFASNKVILTASRSSPRNAILGVPELGDIPFQHPTNAIATLPA